jgi:hypothetical protein
MKGDSYHNTTDSGGPDKRRYESKAKSQEEKVLRYFKNTARRGLTPSEVRRIVFAGIPPITSVRRAITNLTDRGKLIKTDEQKKGPEGRPEYVWRLPTQQYKQRDLF